MTMTLWPLVVVTGVPVISAVYLVLRPRSGHGMRTATRFFYCPVRERRVRVDFRTASDGRSTGVIGCSAFIPPTAITCGEFCLRPSEFRRAHARPSRQAGG